MLDGLLQYLSQRSPVQLLRDAVDVLLVYYIFYRALLVLRGTRAMQVGMGMLVVFILYVVAQLLQLVTVLSLMSTLISSAILVVVVVFQNDIRRGLQRVGSRAWFAGLAKSQESKVIEEVVEAATELARHRIGALITFEQDANLDEFVGAHKGHVLDAAVTRELLVALFIPEGMNKLHDGAVVIRNLRIAKAGVFFPMPEGRVVDESFGSRHRAAMGITEETDAVVVIVSEERGTISFCFNGNIASNLDGPKLRTMLEAIFSPKARKKKKSDAQLRISQTPAPPDVTSAEGAREERTSLLGRVASPESTPISIRTRESDAPPPSLKRPSLDGGETPPPLRARPSDGGETPPPLRIRPSDGGEEAPAPLRPRTNPEPDSTTATGRLPRVSPLSATPIRTPVTRAPDSRRGRSSADPIRTPVTTGDDDRSPSDPGENRNGDGS